MQSKAHAQVPECTACSRRIATFTVELTLILLTLCLAAPAQNSVPPTARQAMTIPQYAAKLARGASRVPHSAQPTASYKPPNPRTRAERDWLPQQNEIYDNGPINGTTDAWTINYGFVVSDSFTVPIDGATVTGLTFGAWTYAGDVAQGVEISITSSEFGGTTYFDGGVSLTQSNCSGNQYGYNVCTETSASFNGPTLSNGTYWVNLQNAVVNDGDPLYWDENSGVGCTSSGCPSLAEQPGTGTIPSEAFTVIGNGECQFNCTECVHDVPQDNFKIIHNFTTGEQPPAPGLAIDQAANLYGATTSGGSHGLGLGYKLASIAENWIFNPLYSFAGGGGGQNPLPGIVGPENAIYGVADGGLQNCGRSGTDYCGVVYKLRPSPTACLTALCSWNETVVYQFRGDPDGASPNGNLVSDSAGNLYGTTTSGGLYGQGAIYKLTPTSGGWTESVFYSFSGGSGGAIPSSLLLGQDGNFYGTTLGGTGGGVIFQLVPSGGGWTENILASFNGCGRSGSGGSCNPVLIQESSGNFYGLEQYSMEFNHPPFGDFWWTFSRIFMMSPSGGGWQFTVLDDTSYLCQPADFCYGYDEGFVTFKDLAIDGAGNLYGTWGWEEGGNFEEGSVFKLLQPYEEQGLVGFAGDDFRDVEVDASGKLYGTTYRCGNSYGTVWQLSP